MYNVWYIWYKYLGFILIYNLGFISILMYGIYGIIIYPIEIWIIYQYTLKITIYIYPMTDPWCWYIC